MKRLSRKTKVWILVVTLSLALASVFVGCTQNDMAKSFGGTMTINLPAGKRLVNATWKESELWYLMKDGDTPPQVYEFVEDSRWGVLEGKVIFVEK